MRSRRHHNNNGLEQIKRGRTRDAMERLARRLGIPYGGTMNYSNLCNSSEYIVGSDAGKGPESMFTVTPVKWGANGEWQAENGVALHFNRETAVALRNLLDEAIATADRAAA